MLQRVHPPQPAPAEAPNPGADPHRDRDRMAAARHSIAAVIQRHVPHNGVVRPAELPALALIQSVGETGPICGMYEPGMALIVQGSKHVALGSEVFTYGDEHFLITSLNLPTVAKILDASPRQPYRSVFLRFDVHEIARLMMDGHVPSPRSPSGERAMGMGRVTWPLLSAFQRLLDLLDEPEAIAAVAPLIQREILFRLLMSEHGDRLRQIGTAGSQSHQIGHAIDWLRNHFAEPLRVDELAARVRMSPSSFHHHFRALTAMSPLQYQKWLRLNDARRLMLAEGLDAATSAYRVGYESASQFSREYSRQFGAPPMRDITQLRQATASAVPA
jgi:AraC-like DNA-binding protein